MEKKQQRPWSQEARARHKAGVARWQREVKIQNLARRLSADGTLDLIHEAKKGGLDVKQWLREQIDAKRGC